MSEVRLGENPAECDDPQGQMIKTPQDLEEMLRLKMCGWDVQCIARQLGYSHHTVKHYVATGGVTAFTPPQRIKKLDDFAPWPRARLLHHAGSTDVVRQELAAEKSVRVSPRTMQCAVAPYRQALRAEALATTRFEIPPGRQPQIDFGERRVDIAGERIKVFVFVATLGYSRRRHVRAFRKERQTCWLEGLEGAFAALGGVPAEILLDTARALVVRHDSQSRTVQFNDKFLAFTHLIRKLTICELGFGAERASDKARRAKLIAKLAAIQRQFAGRIVDIDANVAE